MYFSQYEYIEAQVLSALSWVRSEQKMPILTLFLRQFEILKIVRYLYTTSRWQAFDVVFYWALKTVCFIPELSEYNFQCKIKIVNVKISQNCMSLGILYKTANSLFL